MSEPKGAGAAGIPPRAKGPRRRGRFAGHEICDSGSWLHAVDIFAISSSYHPTAAGQDQGYLPVFTGAAG